MDTARTTPRAPRLLAALALAAALVAIPAVRPGDAGAMRMSERRASWICYANGGSIHYESYSTDSSVWDMTCEFPSGISWTCSGGGLGSMVMVECY
jgi:hypothetical protein